VARWRRWGWWTLAGLATLGVVACSSDDGDDASGSTSPGEVTTTVAARTTDDVWQVGTITELSAGDFAGRVPVGDLLDHGTTGLGTFDGLAGEMVIVDGVVYQVPVDGVPVEADADVTTPFAQVTPFEADEVVDLTGPTSCDEMKATIDAAVGTDDDLVAVRIEATFSLLQTRSVPAQTAPYPPLDAIVPAEQVTFDLTDVDAIVVGFRTADALESVSPPGYHFHGVTADRQAGGHVLDCQVTEGTVEVDRIDALDLAFAR
jgi:acetolactate decarboxylase